MNKLQSMFLVSYRNDPYKKELLTKDNTIQFINDTALATLDNDVSAIQEVYIIINGITGENVGLKQYYRTEISAMTDLSKLLFIQFNREELVC